MFTTGPYPLALGTPVILLPPETHNSTALLLNNQSPLTCAVSSAGPAEWLQPWESHVYPLGPGAIVTVAPDSSLVPGASGQLYASWISPADTLAGTYPSPLAAAAIATASVLPTRSNRVGRATGTTVSVATLVSGGTLLPLTRVYLFSAEIASDGTGVVATIENHATGEILLELRQPATVAIQQFDGHDVGIGQASSRLDLKIYTIASGIVTATATYAAQ